VEQNDCCRDRRLTIRSHTGHRTGALRLLEDSALADEMDSRSDGARRIAILFVLSLRPVTRQRVPALVSRLGQLDKWFDYAAALSRCANLSAMY
jgi:hypothetical protein